MSSIEALQHPLEEITGGGKVILLNTGAVFTPEDVAMLQALYSRDPGSIFKHLETLDKVGSGKFMDSYYIGYGHKSIGDCGTITLFIEGVSMLVAKAIQDSMLYSGQECSTRFLDFSKQSFIDPLGIQDSFMILNKWRALYLKSLDPIREHLKKQFPMQEGEKESDYQKAIKARSFDIARSLLPAGAATNLSWHGNLRQIRDRLCYLRNHPLQEVRKVAEAMEKLLIRIYPNSFNNKRYPASEEYNKQWMEHGYYVRETRNWTREFKLAYVGLDFSLLGSFLPQLRDRPEKTELPKQIAECGTLRFEFPLDFGSFRDIQRHRGVVERMPLLTTELGFEPWYLEAMPEEVRIEVKKALNSFEYQYQYDLRAKFSQDNLQYLIPMGYQVPISVTGDIPALVYLIELRATPFVHPTLQRRALQMGQTLKHLLCDFGFKLFVDEDSFGRFDVRRGKQDIVEKTTSVL